MTTGRREPTFHGVGQGGDEQPSAQRIHATTMAASTNGGLTRFVSGFQAISTMIGVPIALASGYTLYKANFAPDLTCTNLRASIVSMLDKNVDPATRRALVKRDVEAFEANCGAVDPDAHAAFKALLTTPVQTAKAPVVKEAPKAEVAKIAPAPVAKEAAKEPVKTELRPAVVDKAPVEKAQVEKAVAEKPVEKAVAPVAAAPTAVDAQADQAMNDTRWLEAVRGALVDNPEQAKPSEVKSAEAKPAAKDPVAERLAKETVFNEMPAREPARPQPVLSSKPGEPVLQPSWSTQPPPSQMPPVQAAMPLPPPVPVSDIARAPADPNRPVPPGSVPHLASTTSGNGGSNSGSWVAQIPFVGRIIDGSTGN